MAPFSLITESPLWHHVLLRKIKNFLKILLNMRTYGPKSVFDALVVGLERCTKEHSLVYNINPKTKDIYPLVYVLWGKDSLEYALSLKKKGIIKKIIAGPNITSPRNSSDIFFHDLIDTIVVPSQRIEKYFAHLSPAIAHKIAVWPAGTPDLYPNLSHHKKTSLLIYMKSCPETFLTTIETILKKKNISYHVLRYGTFVKDDYIHMLSTVSGEIYLQESETQGLALQESWMMDVPTLAWNRGYFQSKDFFWYDTKISAPYLTKESGLFFYSLGDFEEKLDLFLEGLHKKTFSARDYYLNHLTEDVSTELFLDLIRKHS